MHNKPGHVVSAPESLSVDTAPQACRYHVGQIKETLDGFFQTIESSNKILGVIKRLLF